MDLLTCRKCSNQKPPSDFYGDPRAASGVQQPCKECRRAKRRENWATDHNGHRTRDRERKAARTPEQIEARRIFDMTYQLMHKFKMTPEDYQRLWDLQDGKCGWCKQPETKIHHMSGQVQRLAVDHDHNCCPTTPTYGNCTRGLLCADCNQLEGKLLSKPGRTLESLAAYLERSKALECTGIAARWCPVCGSCTCSGEWEWDEPGCPLHGTDSKHAGPGGKYYRTVSQRPELTPEDEQKIKDLLERPLATGGTGPSDTDLQAVFSDHHPSVKLKAPYDYRPALPNDPYRCRCPHGGEEYCPSRVLDEGDALCSACATYEFGTGYSHVIDNGIHKTYLLPEPEHRWWFDDAGNILCSEHPLEVHLQGEYTYEELSDGTIVNVRPT